MDTERTDQSNTEGTDQSNTEGTDQSNTEGTDQSVAHLVIDALRRSEIDTLFCLPGVQNDDFFNVLLDARDIRPIVTRHEQGAAYMAMGAAQVTGKPAAFCVVPGPGMLNASAALTSAYWGYARVLAVIGAIATEMQGRNVGTLHDLDDPTAILDQLTKSAVSVGTSDRAAELIQSTLDALHGGVPRPVSLEVPADVWSQSVDGELTDPQPTIHRPDSVDIARAAELMQLAKTPLIVVGSGAYDSSSTLIELAERMQIPVTTRRQGHGVMPTAHPLFLPLPAAYWRWADVDLVIGIGSRMEFPLNNWGIDDDLSIIQINVDESELDRHNHTTVAIHADANSTCLALLESIGSFQADSRTAEVATLRARFEEETAHLTPQREYTAAIREVLPEDGVLVEDVTQIGFASHLFYDHLAPRTFLTSGAAGTLGAGTAVAIGASAVTDRPVVGITGDGGFMFTATELATAVQHNIPCNILLFNDGAFGNVKRIQKVRFGADRTIASTLQNPDFQKMCQAFGVRSWQADSPTSMKPALAAAIEHDGPSLVEVKVGEMPNPWPFFRPPPIRGSKAQK